MTKGFILLFWGVILCPIIYAPTVQPDSSLHFQSALEIIQLQNCNNPPCLLGSEVLGASIEDVRAIIAESNLADSENLYSEDQSIFYWRWNEQITTTLNAPSGLAYAQFLFTENQVIFREGVSQVNIVFRIALGKIIDEIGTPSYLVPYTYDNWGNMYYMVKFKRFSGIFIVVTRCDEPRCYCSYLFRPYPIIS
jgi:hypothetical protein